MGLKNRERAKGSRLVENKLKRDATCVACAHADSGETRVRGLDEQTSNGLETRHAQEGANQTQQRFASSRDEAGAVGICRTVRGSGMVAEATSCQPANLFFLIWEEIFAKKVTPTSDQIRRFEVFLYF